VIVVRRPPVPEGVPVVTDPGQAARWVRQAHARRLPPG
jgi:precorrin-6A/cobalt-precorrin-6A reductase